MATTSKTADLRARWTTAEGASLSQEVFRCLVRNQDIAPLVDRHDGRLDLRGISLAGPTITSSEERTLLGRVFRIDRKSGVTQLRKATIAGVDFSHAELPHVMFVDSEIRDCRFDRARLAQSGFWGCRVSDTSFEGADLRSVVLGGAEHPPTPYRGVSFASADLRDAVPGAADFTDCDFSNARLDKVEFEGSTFLRCRFAGRLQEVIFAATEYGHPERVGALIDVDMSHTVLYLCAFRGLDLSAVKLPGEPEHVVFENYACAVERARSALEGTTDGDRLWLLGLLEHEAAWMLPGQRRGILGVAELHPDGTLAKGAPIAAWLKQLDRDCGTKTASA